MQLGVKYTCAFYRDGKLYLILDEGLIVMKAWPPQAWYRASPIAPWQHLRPKAFDLNMVEPLRRIRRAQRRTTHTLWTLFERHGAEVQTFLEQGNAPERGEPVEAIGAILRRLVAKRYHVGDRSADLGCIASLLTPVLPWFTKLDRERCAFETFFAAIPAEVREVVAQFPERHFSLTSFCARCPGGLDLLRSSPALALMLANCWAFGRKVQRPLRSCRGMLRKPQRKQLEWLGFVEPGKSTVRLLRKVPATCCTVGLLLSLRSALRNKEARKYLEHLPRINGGVVRLVSDPKLLPHVSYSLLKEIGQCPQEDLRAHLGRRMARILPLLREDLPLAHAKFRSMRSLETFMKLAQSMGWDVLFRPYPINFPQAPFPDNHWLHAIASPVELVEEGITQRHCVATYANIISRGYGYAYRVLLPGWRATLLLHREGVRLPWAIAECRAVCNTMVELTVLLRIQAWLEAEQAIQSQDPLQDSAGQMGLPMRA